MAEDRATSLMTSALRNHVSLLEYDARIPLRQLELLEDVPVCSPFLSSRLPENRTEGDGPEVIPAGTYGLIVTEKDVILERVLEAKPEQAYVDGSMVLSYIPIQLTTEKDPHHFYQLTLFDVLIMLAIVDAKSDGRDGDAEWLSELLPTAIPDGETGGGWEPLRWGYDEREYRSITREQHDGIMQVVTPYGVSPLTIPKQDTNPVRQHVDPIGKLANRITDIRLFSEGGVDLDVTGENEKREVTTWVSLTSEALDGVDTHGHVIENIDREIMAAFATLWKADNRVVTINQIASATGFRNQPSKAKAAMIEAHVDKLSRIWADVDATKELRGREIADGDIVDSAKFGGHLLEVRKTEIVTANGRRAVGYRILQPPIVMQHAALSDQIVSTPARLMKVGDGSDTDLNVVLRNRLATRIQRMRNKKTRSRRIRYIHSAEHPERAGLFEVAGVNMADRDKKARAVEFASSCLQGWVDMGWISGFSEFRDRGRGRPVGGVDITL